MAAEKFNIEATQIRLRNITSNFSKFGYDDYQFNNTNLISNNQRNQNLNQDSLSMSLSFNENNHSWKTFNEEDLKIISSSLHLLSTLPQNKKKLSSLFSIIRSQYPPDFDEYYISTIYYTTVSLLRRISSKQDTIPQILIDLS